MNSALSLNRLKHDGAGGRSYRGGKRFQIVEGAMVKPGKEGIEAFFHLALGGRCDSSKCAAMKGLVEGDDLMTRLSLVPGPRSAKTPGELDETVV